MRKLLTLLAALSSIAIFADSPPLVKGCYRVDHRVFCNPAVKKKGQMMLKSAPPKAGDSKLDQMKKRMKDLQTRQLQAPQKKVKKAQPSKPASTSK